MRFGTGINGPAEVEESSTTAITVKCTSAQRVSVYSSATGTSFDVDVVDGKATFELPAGATAGSTITITDRDDLDNSHTITVVPASSTPP